MFSNSAVQHFPVDVAAAVLLILSLSSSVLSLCTSSSSSQEQCHLILQCEDDVPSNFLGLVYKLSTSQWNVVSDPSLVCPRSDSTVPHWQVSLVDSNNDPLTNGTYCSETTAFNSSVVCIRDDTLVFLNLTSIHDTRGTFTFCYTSLSYNTTIPIRYANTSIVPKQDVIYFNESSSIVQPSYFIFSSLPDLPMSVFHDGVLLTSVSIFCDETTCFASNSERTVIIRLNIANPSSSAEGEYTLVAGNLSAVVTLVANFSSVTSSMQQLSSNLSPSPTVSISQRPLSSGLSTSQMASSEFSSPSSSPSSTNKMNNLILSVSLPVVGILLVLIVLAVIGLIIAYCCTRYGNRPDHVDGVNGVVIDDDGRSVRLGSYSNKSDKGEVDSGGCNDETSSSANNDKKQREDPPKLVETSFVNNGQSDTPKQCATDDQLLLEGNNSSLDHPQPETPTEKEEPTTGPTANTIPPTVATADDVQKILVVQEEILKETKEQNNLLKDMKQQQQCDSEKQSQQLKATKEIAEMQKDSADVLQNIHGTLEGALVNGGGAIGGGASEGGPSVGGANMEGDYHQSAPSEHLPCSDDGRSSSSDQNSTHQLPQHELLDTSSLKDTTDNHVTDPYHETNSDEGIADTEEAEDRVTDNGDTDHDTH